MKKPARIHVTRPDGSRTRRYRYVVEQSIGRRLTSDEHIHHINGDHTDDRLENLMIVTREEHLALHKADCARWARSSWKHEWSRDHACCVKCGRTDREHQGKGLCSYCYFMNRERTKRGRPEFTPCVYVTVSCQACGTEFEQSKSLLQRRPRKYCSHACYVVDRKRMLAEAAA